MPLQNISDGVTRQHVTHISESTLDPQISPASVFVGETKNKRSNLRRRPWAAQCTARAAVVLLAINFRCQANKVAGVTIVATCSRIFRLSFFALAARRQRLSVNRIRR